MANEKQLDIYIDESGDFSVFSKKNPFYSVAFVMVESSFDNSVSINKYQSNLNNLLGGNHFVHVGNLVRAEKPYQDMLREQRWKLFYALYLFSIYSKYNVAVASIEKELSDEGTISSLAASIIKIIESNEIYLTKFKSIVLHYDFGQGPLSGILGMIAASIIPNCSIVKTKQSDEPFMQIADLYSYFELLKYKVSKGYLSNSESKFFGGIRNLKNNYLKTLIDKYR